jgi:hypothetical protein
MGDSGLAEKYRILDELLAAQRSGDAERVNALTDAWQRAYRRRSAAAPKAKAAQKPGAPGAG